MDTDILIIGGGVAGPAMATALRHSGQRIVMLEKNAGLLDTARGDHLQPSTVEILDNWGALEAFFLAGAKQRAGSIWYTGDGEEILNSALSEVDIPFPYFLYLNHELISRVFLSLAEENAGFRLIRPITNWWLEDQSQDRITVRIKTKDTEQTITTRVLVGADGRNSRVRKIFDMAFTSHRYECPIAVLFGKSQQTTSGNQVRAYVGRDAIVSVIPRTNGDSKVGLSIDKTAVAQWRGASSSDLIRKVEAIAPATSLYDLKFADVYPPIFLSSQQWIKGRVVLIGDACHAMHPARSQGMNISIRCIAKLAEYLGGIKGDWEGVEEFLSRYEAEVKPPVDKLLENNHTKGLEFESMTPDSFLMMTSGFRKIQADRKLRQQYTLQSAGYGIGS